MLFIPQMFQLAFHTLGLKKKDLVAKWPSFRKNLEMGAYFFTAVSILKKSYN